MRRILKLFRNLFGGGSDAFLNSFSAFCVVLSDFYVLKQVKR